jgi:hypothetical protein
VNMPTHSRFAILLFFLVLLLASAGSISAQTYFPEKAFGDDPIMYNWYSGILKILKEPSLLEQAHSTSSESYRFLWLRTFHHPISVRLEVKADGTSIVTTKVGNGAAGFPYTNKGLPRNVSRPLAQGETQALLALVAKVGFWSIPTYLKDPSGNDGSEWIVEAAKEGKYHVAARWSPASNPSSTKRPVSDLGLAFINIGQLKIPDEEFY